jgi:hypothetical protein
MEKQEKGKKPFYKKWWVWLIAGLVILVIVVPKNNDTKVTTDKVTTEKTEKANVETKEKEPISKWIYNETTDKMTSKSIRFASIKATDELQFKFPYGGGSKANFTIRKKDKETDIYLSVKPSQFICPIGEGNIRIKFDTKQPKKYSIVSPSDGSSDMVFIRSEKEIIANLKNSKTMIIEAEFYQEGIRQIEFNTENFKWD